MFPRELRAVASDQNDSAKDGQPTRVLSRGQMAKGDPGMLGETGRHGLMEKNKNHLGG